MKRIKVVCAVIENEKNLILVCKRSGNRFLTGKWEFPGGKVEENELYEEALLREIREELNINIKILDYIGSNNYVYTTDNGYLKIELIAYRCKYLNDTIKLIDHSEYKWVKKEDLEFIDFAKANIKILEYIKER